METQQKIVAGGGWPGRNALPKPKAVRVCWKVSLCAAILAVGSALAVTCRLNTNAQLPDSGFSTLAPDFVLLLGLLSIVTGIVATVLERSWDARCAIRDARQSTELPKSSAGSQPVARLLLIGGLSLVPLAILGVLALTANDTMYRCLCVLGGMVCTAMTAFLVRKHTPPSRAE
jgi:hypothetical protein